VGFYAAAEKVSIVSPAAIDRMVATVGRVRPPPRLIPTSILALDDPPESKWICSDLPETFTTKVAKTKKCPARPRAATKR
jgi:hypothetical protein